MVASTVAKPIISVGSPPMKANTPLTPAPRRTMAPVRPVTPAAANGAVLATVPIAAPASAIFIPFQMLSAAFAVPAAALNATIAALASWILVVTAPTTVAKVFQAANPIARVLRVDPHSAPSFTNLVSPMTVWAITLAISGPTLATHFCRSEMFLVSSPPKVWNAASCTFWNVDTKFSRVSVNVPRSSSRIFAVYPCTSLNLLESSAILSTAPGLTKATRDEIAY